MNGNVQTLDDLTEHLAGVPVVQRDGGAGEGDERGVRERVIVEMRYGLKSGTEMTQKEVADALGISQSYISRLEKKIMWRLRKKLEEKM